LGDFSFGAKKLGVFWAPEGGLIVYPQIGALFFLTGPPGGGAPQVPGEIWGFVGIPGGLGLGNLKGLGAKKAFGGWGRIWKGGDKNSYLWFKQTGWFGGVALGHF